MSVKEVVCMKIALLLKEDGVKVLDRISDQRTLAQIAEALVLSCRFCGSGGGGGIHIIEADCVPDSSS